MKTWQERVSERTIEGDSSSCWEWRGRRTAKGYPTLARQLGGGKATSVTVSRVLVHLRDGLSLDERWVARHTCDNPRCVNPSHIISGTYQQNTDDMWTRGRGPRGDRRPNGRFKVGDIHEIRRRLAEGESQSSIARSYGVQQGHIGQIHRKKIWSWLE